MHTKYVLDFRGEDFVGRIFQFPVIDSLERFIGVSSVCE